MSQLLHSTFFQNIPKSHSWLSTTSCAIVRTAKIKVGLRRYEQYEVRERKDGWPLAEKRNYSENDSRMKLWLSGYAGWPTPPSKYARCQSAVSQ
ncbi:unnamed protein product [Macrosiphum euphorbiae]|uniref:Uncharacterized protein n=1 Tax=Macrosiphum euphorbiae TaxID=13131 RepID=A0AAV0WSS6_9HEMI|nr:unnamed protein product [Macrosiphum euphorbiae]